MVTGSPGKTEPGEATQARVTVGGGAIVPKFKTIPVLKRAMLKLPRVTGYMFVVNILIVGLETRISRRWSIHGVL